MPVRRRKWWFARVTKENEKLQKAQAAASGETAPKKAVDWDALKSKISHT